MRALKQWSLPGVFSFLTMLLCPAGVYAQGCPLCYQSAAASGPGFIQALRNGILIMLFPPLLILGAITFVAYKKRNQFNSEDSSTHIEFVQMTPTDWSIAEEASPNP